MRTEVSESPQRAGFRSPGSGNGEPEGDLESVNPALLDLRHVESLLLNLDRSLHVHSPPQFFNWTQGLLQSLMPHAVLICGMHSAAANSFRVDCYSTFVPDANIFGGILLRDAAGAPSLIRSWSERGYMPISFDLRDVRSISGGDFARELGRIGVSRLIAHGTLDTDREVESFFVFGCTSSGGEAHQSYLLQILTPHLHAALVRLQMQSSKGEKRNSAINVRVLTERERDVLRWVYLGKSNGEIGAILQISPLTVKNHVQNILRKLNVVNRAQAVGKALDARIITP